MIKNSVLVYVEDESWNIITNEDASLDYFTGGDPASPEDKGFARIPWVKTRFDTNGKNIEGLEIWCFLSFPSGMYGKVVKMLKIKGL